MSVAFAIYHRESVAPTARDREIVDLLAHTAALIIERDQQTRRQAAAEKRAQRARMTSQYFGSSSTNRAFRPVPRPWAR